MTAQPERVRIRVRGAVQGVGFRPFVYSLATRHNMSGFVLNDSHGVLAEIECHAQYGGEHRQREHPRKVAPHRRMR